MSLLCNVRANIILYFYSLASLSLFFLFSLDTKSMFILVKLLHCALSNPMSTNISVNISVSHVSKLLSIWCDTFKERKPLKADKAKSDAEMFLEGHAKRDKTNIQERTVDQMKVQSLKYLFGIITQWIPKRFPSECCHTVLRALHLGLHSLANQSQRGPLLSLLVWFKTCVIRSSEIRNLMLQQTQSSIIGFLLQMFYNSGRNDRECVEYTNPDNLPELCLYSHLNIRQELVFIFMTLLAHAEKLRLSGEFSDGNDIVVHLNKDPFPQVVGALQNLLENLSYPTTEVSEQAVFTEEGNAFLFRLSVQSFFTPIPVELLLVNANEDYFFNPTYRIRATP